MKCCVVWSSVQSLWVIMPKPKNNWVLYYALDFIYEHGLYDEFVKYGFKRFCEEHPYMKFRF